MPSAQVALEEAKLRFAVHLRTIDDKHPLTNRTTLPLVIRGRAAGNRRIPRSKVQRVAQLLPATPRNVLASPHFSDGSRQDPTQGQGKDIAAQNFTTWWESLGQETITVFSDGSEQQINGTRVVTYGYAIYQGQAAVATGQGSLNALSHVFDAEAIGACRGLKHALQLSLPSQREIVLCSTKEVKKLRRSLHHISAQNSILHGEIRGLREALLVKKRHKRKSYTLQLNNPQEYNGGAVFWSPRKVRQARDDEMVRRRQQHELQLQKAERSELKKQARLLKLQKAQEKRLERERLKEVREKERAAKLAEKERQKAARDAEKATQLFQKEDSRDVTRQAPSAPQAQAALPTRAVYAPNVSWQKLFWVSFPDTKRLDETATLAIQLFPEDRESLGHDPWLAEACSMTLHNTVIPSGNEDCFIHQGLVTALATKALAQISVDVHTWDWLATQLQGNLLSRSCTDKDGNALHGILFLHWTTNEPTNPTLDKVYSTVRLLKHIHPASFRVYPNENEAEQERNKLGDIRALDEVASSSPQEFSYRPRTCYGHGPCKLRDYQTTVHKRTQSGCATHVHVRKRGDHYELTCQPEAQMLETTSQNSRGRKKKPIVASKSSRTPAHSADHSAHWFHQEFVPSLQSCEFRVFIATEPSKKGIRGRIGQVIAIAKTSFNSDTQALAVREFLPEDLEPALTRLDLVRFALFVFERLRARPDSMIFFESLEVGVRLDIGVANTRTAKKAFFVNEITRWYGAHYFSYHICAEPKTQICKAFAGAFAMVINSGTGY
ncbi:hypothetical protein PtrM4_056040 [Pyrenophora tritici-repentis]|uniref:RNase H type-1 domain-containing protein n=1 Tax=Pyrenophora tritici-repentis TaxID=45151 RepID=A0A834VRA3_9PLEO|nr:hypothetical protein PtrM4_056040 [Pyrenophora tritici-repentis]